MSMMREPGNPRSLRMATGTRATEGRYFELVRECPLRPLKNEGDLDRAIAVLNRLLDIEECRRSQDEEDYMHVLGTLIGEYEDVNWPMPSEVEEREVLRRHREKVAEEAMQIERAEREAS